MRVLCCCDNAVNLRCVPSTSEMLRVAHDAYVLNVVGVGGLEPVSP